MTLGNKSRGELLRENEGLRRQLEESNETLQAIQRGEVDAIVVSGPEGEQVYTLKSADYTYRLLVENMGEGAATLNEDGFIIYCNARLAEMLEVPLERIMTESILQFVAPSDKGLFDTLIRKALTQTAEAELNLVTSKRKPLPVNISLNSLQLEDVRCLCMIATDLTQQLRFQEIVAEERLSKSIIEQASEAIVVCDKEGQVIRCSQAAKEICKENPLMRDFDAVFPLRINIAAEQQSSTEQVFSVRECLLRKRIKGVRCSYTGKDGQELSLLLSAGPILSEESKVLGCTVTLTDVTLLAQAQEKIQRLNLMLRSVRNINQLITRENDRVRLLKGTCDNLVNARSCYNSWAVLLDESMKIISYAETGLGKAFSPIVRQAKRGNLPTCCHKALGQKEVVVIEDPRSTCTDCALYRQCESGVGLAMSLEHGAKVYGVLCASIPKLTLYDTEELLLFKEVAIDVSFALYNLELEEARRKAERALATEKERLEVTLRSSGDGIVATDVEGNVALINRVAEELSGWTEREAIGKPIGQILNLTDEITHRPVKTPVENVIKSGRIIGLTNHVLLISRDGTERLIADSGAPIRDDAGNIIGVVLVFRDVSDLRKFEEERIKVEKLDSIGTLAGGIAHDFNNLLTGIMGNISLAKRHVEPGGIAFDRLEEAEKASSRARDLTQQLLTFSAGGRPIKKLTHLGRLIRESATFALSGSNIKPEFSLPDDLWAVEIDEGQINQVILNIVKNADEAMPDGGVVSIGAGHKVISRQGALPLPRGNYVEITIKDQGVGIQKEHLSRIFEPYFTTKQKGSALATGHDYLRSLRLWLRGKATLLHLPGKNEVCPS